MVTIQNPLWNNMKGALILLDNKMTSANRR